MHLIARAAVNSYWFELPIFYLGMRWMGWL